MSKDSNDKDAMDDSIYDSLNKISGGTQAVLLPVLLSISLAISYFFINFKSFQTTTASTIDLSLISQSLPFISFLSNFSVAFLFSKVEIQWLLTLFKQNNPVVKSIFVSLFITSIAFLFPTGNEFIWPLQNLINVFITITIARALQLEQLPLIILSLLGLVTYDVAAVIGTKAFTDGGQSVMVNIQLFI